MAKITYAQGIINEMPETINAIKANIESDKWDSTYCDQQRAAINAGVIMAIFGAEMLEKKGELYLKFNKTPATTAELSEISANLDALMDIEDSVVVASAEDDTDIDVSASTVVESLKPEKVTKKTLTEYLLSGPQAIGRLRIGPTEVLTLAALSEEYRKNRKTKIILISVIAAAIIAAGVTTSVIVVHNHKKKLNEVDDNPDAVDICEDDVVAADDVIDDVVDDAPIPHVDLDM